MRKTSHTERSVIAIFASSQYSEPSSGGSTSMNGLRIIAMIGEFGQFVVLQMLTSGICRTIGVQRMNADCESGRTPFLTFWTYCR